jgi:neopullulanase
MRLLLVWLFVSALCAAPPRVDKVEPPSWWKDGRWGPIRVMLSGVNLQGAAVDVAGATNLRYSERGDYMWFTLDLAAHRAGKHTWAVRNAEGAAQFPFELLPKALGPERRRGLRESDLIYLAMPDRFYNGDTSNDDPPVSKGLFRPASPRGYHGGDIAGIIQKLDYLYDLGVSVLWLTPWYDNANRLDGTRYNGIDSMDYHGYGAIDFYAVDEHFGTVANLRELVQRSAGRIRIMQDQVANHTGPLHPWVEAPPLPNWYHGSKSQHEACNWQIWTQLRPAFDSATYRGMVNGWFGNLLPDLNQEEPEVETYLIQNALWWVGVTGLELVRQDTAPYVPVSFWAKWNRALHTEFEGIETLGEVLDRDPQLVSLFQRGEANFDSVFDFPLAFGLRQAYGKQGGAYEVNKVLIKDDLYARPEKLVTFLGLHDMSRFEATWAQRREAFSKLFSLRGVPLIYYGDELGMPGGEDPDNRRDMQWAPQSSEAEALRDHIRRLVSNRRRQRQ